ncbi:arrestin domain-containing protein 3-like [Liolophura sinensis]|uniref:arrestin domain-containing protein 3-like n=1 Tax=Liolophura sinensis TaxID=3198878 RepID=UPI0031592EE7
MGKLNHFLIFLNNPQAVYFCGQVIEGYVSVDLREPMKMRGLRLLFEGGANVHWTEQHTTGSGKNRRTVTRHYSARESYFSQILVLYGKAPGAGGDNPVHPAGQHMYPFRLQLPYGIPSSFETTVGRVRYTISGVIDKPWKFDHKTKAAFTVINLLDLNREPLALSVPQGQNSKTLCCLCCKSGPIEAVCRLERMGYVPGEAIVINAEITNGSSRKMSCSYAELSQVISFHASTKTKSSTTVIARVNHSEIAPGGSDVWSGDRLHIPPIPPSRLDGCSIIDITYILKFCVDPSGPAFDLQIPLNILIGSIPHQQVVERHANFGPPGGASGFAPTMNPTSPAVPPAPGATPSAPVLPPNMPPPSYAECVSGKVNIRDEEDNEYTGGNLEYTPRYTYYNWEDSSNQNPK